MICNKFKNILGVKTQIQGARKEPAVIIGSEISLYDQLKSIYLDCGAAWDEVNMFGLRNESDQDKDVWNDKIGVVFQHKVYLYSGTCDPSAYWTKICGPTGKGVAHICLGYHENVYMVGEHKGHEAMVQYGNKIRIWRDGNNNFRKDNEDIIQTGYFGTNIHRASAIKVTDKIGKYSAGCQVINDVEDHLKYMSIVKSSNKYKSNKKSRFSYMLLKESDVKMP